MNRVDSNMRAADCSTMAPPATSWCRRYGGSMTAHATTPGKQRNQMQPSKRSRERKESTSFCCSRRKERWSANTNRAHSATRIPMSTMPGQCSKSWKLLKSSSKARPRACSTTCTDARTRSVTMAGERSPLSSCPGRWKPASNLPRTPATGSLDPSVQPNARAIKTKLMISSEAPCAIADTKSSANQVCRHRKPLPSPMNRERCHTSHSTESACRK
mmetsp:Transcript_17014/g.40552  ORF Transcript_17014/g.40552 Transcript_17014/m.40552 type:complete len:216 (+) Transcript_17014:118-765(+)